MYPYFELLGHTVSMYFLFATIGLVFAVILALLRRNGSQCHTSSKNIFYTILCAFIGALIGAKALQLIGYIIRDGGSSDFWTLQNWKNMFSGVGVFYGGLIGGTIAVLKYVRSNKLDFWDISDILVPSILLFHAFGRLGCFFAGCCYGVEASWGIEFTHSTIAPNGVSFVTHLL